MDNRLGSLFGEDAELVINQEAIEDARRLLAAQVSAEFNSPLTRHNLPRPLRREKHRGPELFEKRLGADQGGLF